MNENSMNCIRYFCIVPSICLCAEGRTRTGTRFPPLPPQDSVSTSSTTSASIYSRSSIFSEAGKDKSRTRSSASLFKIDSVCTSVGELNIPINNAKNI